MESYTDLDLHWQFVACFAESNSHNMLDIDQSFKCEYSSSDFNFIVSF